MADKYQPEFPKITKGNSKIIQERLIVFISKDHLGNDFKLMKDGKAKVAYYAYDYLTKVCLTKGRTKEDVISFLEKQDFGVLDEHD